jgi:hypothetical protein
MSFFLWENFLFTAMKKEAKRSSEMFVAIYQTTRRHSLS